jgi:hypothetical protein
MRLLPHPSRVVRALALGLAVMHPLGVSAQRVAPHLVNSPHSSPSYVAHFLPDGGHAAGLADSANADTRIIPRGIIGLVAGAVLGGYAGQQLAHGACELPCHGGSAGPTFLGALVGAVIGFGIDYALRPLLDRHRLRQIPRQIDIQPALRRESSDSSCRGIAARIGFSLSLVSDAELIVDSGAVPMHRRKCTRILAAEPSPTRAATSAIDRSGMLDCTAAWNYPPLTPRDDVRLTAQATAVVRHLS